MISFYINDKISHFILNILKTFNRHSIENIRPIKKNGGCSL